jgi:pilus assembly protein Flp/PilA
MHSLASPKKNQKGQGLVEYALILVLVAIVVIAALMILGPIIGNVFSKVNSSLSNVSAGSGVVEAPIPASCTSGSASASGHTVCNSLMNQNNCTHNTLDHSTDICTWY